MATVVTQTTRKYKDLDLSFTAHPIRKDVNKHIDEMAVINSVKNLLLTSHYEKLFRPEIGSNLSKLLFEQILYIEKINNEATPKVVRSIKDNVRTVIA